MENDMDAVTATANAKLATAYRPLKDHALREALANEMHARPAEGLRSPLRVTHLAMLSGEGNSEVDRAHFARRSSERATRWTMSRSRSTTRSMPGRRIFTTTSPPPCSRAR